MELFIIIIGHIIGVIGVLGDDGGGGGIEDVIGIQYGIDENILLET